jgi:hypothetical protein
MAPIVAGSVLSAGFFFAAVGLAAGSGALLVFLIPTALRWRGAWEIFLISGMFSVLGWILISVPIALAFPARPFSRLAWPGRMLIGATLGRSHC